MPEGTLALSVKITLGLSRREPSSVAITMAIASSVKIKVTLGSNA